VGQDLSAGAVRPYAVAAVGGFLLGAEAADFVGVLEWTL
jgi:hypothetical protein